MQKLIQRTQRARRGAQRALEKAKKREAVEDNYKRKQEELHHVRKTGQDIRAARKNRNEDWETGALAPRRDVGERAELYGTKEIFDMRLPIKRPEDRLKWWPIRQGDRVVVVNGRERGRIGEVWGVDKERNSVEVNDVNVVDFHVPDWVPKQPGDTRRVVGHMMPIPLQDVRLVHPLPDPKTGVPKDVVIEKLVPVNRTFDKNTREWDDGDRVIHGTRTIIPWPPKADEEFEDNEDDTLRITVEEQTFRPLLLHPPMPMSVIDELRNKYSKFRTRHEWEFEEKMKRIDQDVERRKELPKTMRTPLQELADLRARQKAAQEKELSSDQLAKIGEVIAQERAKVADALKRLES